MYLEKMNKARDRYYLRDLLRLMAGRRQVANFFAIGVSTFRFGCLWGDVEACD